VILAALIRLLEDWMKRFVEGTDRKQSTLFPECLEDWKAFSSGRSLATWIGLVPKQHSTGGKDRLGRISKQGNRHLRWLLVAGAMAVIRYACQHGTNRPWLIRLMDRRPIKVAAVASARP